MTGFSRINSKKIKIELEDFGEASKAFEYTEETEPIWFGVWPYVDSRDLSSTIKFEHLGMCNRVTLTDVEHNNIICSFQALHLIDVYILWRNYGMKIVISETDLYNV